MEFTVATAFGLALGISGMGRPEQVLAFLDVSDGTWDPTLALVMGGALCVTLPLYHIFIVSDGFVRANCGGEPFTPVSPQLPVDPTPLPPSHILLAIHRPSVRDCLWCMHNTLHHLMDLL